MGNLDSNHFSQNQNNSRRLNHKKQQKKEKITDKKVANQKYQSKKLSTIKKRNRNNTAAVSRSSGGVSPEDVDRPSPPKISQIPISEDALIESLQSKVNEFDRFRELTHESLRRYREGEKMYIFSK